jgi:uncharacterized protein (TIGR03086 family)
VRDREDPGTLVGMNSAELHRRAVAEFAARLDALGASGPKSATWTQATPCADWDVRALVNHITYEDRWTTPILDGKTVAEVGDAFDGDLLGDDPIGAFAAASAEATGTSSRVPLDRTVHLSFGDVPAGEYLYQLAADHLVHGWDLAAATGGDRHFDEEVVAAAADWFTERESLYRQSGSIGARVPVSSADPQDRLMAAFGRDPAWRPRG